ncbi:alpha/beta hydrolase fold-1 [Cordyceps fumosorosea ARSEF 2679]|uniref:Alpha/beta hydrolase fold-1 n=1 Tax=Cordyceps fumosorosea (strain ARSEF 2679) TaxID=1081104 RepID=A0A168AJV3_CORFA|nr:alpha/beta hydrolase fold-1 [Cordyceps fumosorosea ARSEF 2679]OAA68847.1 alpha/beta hydrolase fold-1 [Cordyceps fumosorosea ARSEF 2679]
MASQDPPPSARAEAAAYISQTSFHKKFTIPATSSHGELTFSYSDVGATPEEQTDAAQVPVVLFHPGLFASRYVGVSLHALATHLGIRVLTVDRPGFGSSTAVPVEKRVDTWVEFVPLLLAHLGIPHITIVSHCAGTVYALNLLYRCRDLLSPERPMAVLMAPWVDPQHSRMTMMQAAQYIPSPAYSLFNGLSRFAARGMLTTVSSSEAVFNAFGMGQRSEAEEQTVQSWAKDNSMKLERECGLSTKIQGALQLQTVEHIFSENTTGSSDEARHCARKSAPGSWGKADDYSVFVEEVARQERSRRGGDADAASPAKLKVMAFFAASDHIIGEGGRGYVEKCWNGKAGDFGDAFEFRSKTVAGTGHDELVVGFDVWKEIVANIRGNEVP